MTLRKACQAGSFYSGDESSLKRELEGCFLNRLGPGRIPRIPEKTKGQLFGLICPHAGFMYSGPAAAFSYLSLAEDGKPDTCIIMGPNHTGRGSGVSIMVEGEWETPLGAIEINSYLARNIQRASGIIDVDEKAHLYEHSIEVQLPFLQYLFGSEVRIVPVCLMMQDLETCIDIGNAIHGALKEEGIIMIASSDMSHYEPQEVAVSKDEAAMEAILDLKPETLHRIVEEKRISMCGYGPISALMYAAGKSRVKSGEKLTYYTSGDITKDYSSVVGYCSIAFKKNF